MKPTIVTLVFLILVPGCTSTKLKTSTLSQAGTLAELQYQQVLNNLAMFCANPELLPSLVTLTDGSAQIADLGSTSYLGDWHRAFASHPNILGSRTVVEQWGMSPVADDTELDLLRIAFRRAVGIDESLQDDNDLANGIAHELIKQLPEVDDYRGSVVSQFEDYKNSTRFEFLKSKEAPKSPWDVKAVLTAIYAPSSKVDYDSLARGFAKYTISSVDNTIIYDNELIKYINIYATYKHLAYYKDRICHINFKDYLYDKDNNKPTYAQPIFFKGDLAKPGFNAESDSSETSGTETRYVTPEAAAVRRQVKEIENDLLSIPCDRSWYGCGRKHDVPHDACFVGHYGDCYVWVCQNGIKELSNLTLKVLSFSSLIKNQSLLTIPGPRFTPASAFPSL